jgi:hypothetical protein
MELQSVQTYQEEKYFHETGHDKQDKYVWMTNQDTDNLHESYYILEKHKRMKKKSNLWALYGRRNGKQRHLKVQRKA